MESQTADKHQKLNQFLLNIYTYSFVVSITNIKQWKKSTEMIVIYVNFLRYVVKEREGSEWNASCFASYSLTAFVWRLSIVSSNLRFTSINIFHPISVIRNKEISIWIPVSNSKVNCSKW